MTNDFARRKRTHVRHAKEGSGLTFHRAIRKYGFENFREEILADIDQDQEFMRFLEIEFIAKYDTVQNGYNEVYGGGGALGHTWNRGRIQSADHIAKRVANTVGFKQSDHQKKRASEVKSKVWIVTSPVGEVMEVRSLNAFCKANGLDQGNLSRGTHLGWKARKKEPS